jgi:hypothetical protein
MESFYRRWALYSPRAEFDWMREQDDPRIANSILPHVVLGLEGSDLTAALDYARALPDAGQQSILAALKSRNCSDPATVAAWVARQPDNELLVSAVAGMWAAKDPNSAVNWIHTLPSSAKDVALRGVAEDSLGGLGSPMAPAIGFERVAELVGQIGDQHIRQTSYESLARRWLKASAESARAWLATAPPRPGSKDSIAQ